MEDHVREILGLPYKNLYSYWQHYWGHCIDTLIDKNNVSFRIMGPRMLLMDLIDELEGHGMANQDNILYFRAEICRLDKSDEVFHQLCHPIIACLLRRMGDKINRDSCILLCKKAIDTLVEKRYFSLLVDWLAKSIDETVNNDFKSRQKINDITHLVIAEYVAAGFVHSEIRRYATDIPEVAFGSDGIVMAAPEKYETLKETDFTSQEDYYKAIGEYLKKRDVYKCLDVLKYHYDEQPRKAFFIVRLNGLKGNIDDYIGDINIYSPKVKRYITGNMALTDIEKVSDERDYVNAAIPIDFISIEQTKENGRIKLEGVLDLIMLTYRTKDPVTVATNLCSVVVDGNEICMSMSVRGNDPMMASGNEMMRYLDALDLTDVKEEGFKFMSDKLKVLEVSRSSLSIRLKNAAHWYTKAISADKDVDALLYSWFAIEGLLKVDSKTKLEVLDNDKDANSLKVIQEFVVSVICKQYFHAYLRGIYRDFIFMTSQHNYYDITNEVIEKAGLNLKTGDNYRDGDFLNAMPDLIDCVNDDIVRDRLIRVQIFYQDDKGLRRKASLIKDDLLMIYRLRNMIAHNAALSCVNIAFYAHEAIYIAQQVIWYVIDNVSGEKTIEEIILGAKLDYQVFLANYDEELNNLKKMEPAMPRGQEK